MARAPSTEQLEAVVTTARLHAGATSPLERQRLQRRLHGQIQWIASISGRAVEIVAAQISEHAAELGPLASQPGEPG